MDAHRSRQPADQAAARVSRLLEFEPVVWLSTVRPDGLPHLLPIWFSWDGESLLIASKPHARKIANLRANPRVMLALGEPEDDFDVGLLEGVAEVLDAPAAEVLPRTHLRKYREQMAAIGLSDEEYLETYSLVVRVRPTKFFPWHGRTTPASGRPGLTRADRRLQAAVRRVAASVAAGTAAAGLATDPAAWPHIAVVAVTGLVIPFMLIAWSELGIDAGVASIFNAATPLITVALAATFLADESLSTQRIAGVAIGFVGVLVVVGGGIRGGGEPLALLGMVGAASSY